MRPPPPPPRNLVRSNSAAAAAVNSAQALRMQPGKRLNPAPASVPAPASNVDNSRRLVPSNKVPVNYTQPLESDMETEPDEYLDDSGYDTSTYQTDTVCNKVYKYSHLV